MTDHPLLRIDSLRLTLGKNNGGPDLVNDAGLTVTHRQVFGLIGESGSGKSLTCLSVMGLLPPGITRAGGGIWINGESMNDLTPARRRSLRGRVAAMILQNPMSCFDPLFTIRSHFSETMASHGLSVKNGGMDQAVEALAEVGFENPGEIMRLYPFQMSGGMLQRVMVALALLMNVPLLIADEPTTDLDVVSQAKVLALLDHMRRDHGMSILLVTHDLGVIARLADQVAVMRAGRIVESRPVRDLFTHPEHPYTQSLLKAHFSLYDRRMNELRQAPAPFSASPDPGEKQGR
jgi:nickel transport system ATP-binding protein